MGKPMGCERKFAQLRGLCRRDRAPGERVARSLSKGMAKMRKVTLDLNELTVESFSTGDVVGMGTVRGHDGPTDCSLCGNDGSLSAYNCNACPSNNTCFGQNTCIDTCDGMANTCQASCNGTCMDLMCQWSRQHYTQCSPCGDTTA